MNVPFHLALRQARLKRLLFRSLVPWIIRSSRPKSECPVHLVAFSGHSDFPEQVASFRSFLIHVGVPERATFISDGTQTAQEAAWLARFPGAPSVISWRDFLKPQIPQKVWDYAGKIALGKKVGVLASLDVSRPTWYVDSDILFFPAACELNSPLWIADSRPRYLLDCYPSLDERLLESEAEKELPVNSGFLFFPRPLDWQPAFSRFVQLKEEGKYFSEQTLVHLTMRESAGLPFPPERFIMRNEDQWRYRDTFARTDTVMRHYISSFRHKMWLRVRWRRGSG